jgi:small subunit ribosomal protein S15
MKKAQTKTEKAKKVATPKVVAKKEAPKAKVSTKAKASKTEVKAAVVAEKVTNGVSEKTKIITEFAVKQNDTGSPEVQIALLSTRISKLATHLEQNKKDNHSRRGLLGLISKRRRLLIYLQGKDDKRYNELAKKLNLKK